jgi:para-nitrobenzyl esterase
MASIFNRREFMRQSTLLGLSGLLLPHRVWGAQEAFPIAQTTYGKVRGMDVSGIKTFRGIHYAASTAGPNRFMPPRKPQPWKGVKDAMAYGPASPQMPGNPTDLYTEAVMWDAHVKPGISEDCLVLNVWTPGLADGGKRPVMFYIHGGGFTSGSGGYPFDGDPMARLGDVVVVTVNERLGPLGFLDLHAIGWPDEFRYAGVAGMMDLVAALEWVRDNAESFGGDPGNVMIFGQSGGAAKTSLLLGMPVAKGLFHRAAAQSGSLLKASSAKQGAEAASRLVAELGMSAGKPHEIQNIDWTAIIEAKANSGFAPALQKEVIPHDPFDPAAPQESRDVPLLVGYLREDSGYRGPTGNITEAELEAWVRQAHPAKADEILKLYRGVYPDATPYQIRARIATDPGTRQHAEMMAERKADQHGAPAYMYLVEWPSPAFEGRFGAVHGTDLGLALADPRIPIEGNTPTARKLAKIVGSCYAAFARTGNPNCDQVPKWPPYDRASRATMIYEQECRVENDPTGVLRSYWEGAQA